MLNWLIKKTKIYKDLENKYKSSQDYLNLLGIEKQEMKNRIKAGEYIIGRNGSVTISPGDWALSFTSTVTINGPGNLQARRLR